MAFDVGQINKDIVDRISISLASTTDIVGAPSGVNVPGVPSSERIPIQFPPKVTTDSKSANWEKIDVASYEPLAIFMGADSRKLGIELTYLVTGHRESGGVIWDGSTIAQVVRRAKSILYQSIGSNAFMSIRNLYGTVGSGGESATFRVMGVSASYSDQVIVSDGSPYPFKTTLSFDLENYTSVSGDTSAGDRSGASEDVGKLIEVTDVAKSAGQFWY